MPSFATLFEPLFGGGGEDERVPFFPQDWSDIKSALADLTRRAIARGIGLVLIALCLGVFLALMTVSASDPSYDHATPNDIDNALGLAGAFAGGLAWAWLGAITPIALLPVFLWGCWIVDGRTELRLWARSLAWIGSLILICLGATAINPWIGSHDAGGWGGLTGHAAHYTLAQALGFFGLASLSVALAAIGGAFGIVLFLWSGALNPFTWRLPALSFNSWSLPSLPLGFLSRFIPFRQRADNEEREYADGDAETDDEDDADEDLDGGQRVGARIEPRAPAFLGAKAQSNAETRILRSEKCKTGKRLEKAAAADADSEHDNDYALPALSLLGKPKDAQRITRESDETLEQNARLLEAVLGDFGVRGRITQVRPGPVVTLYELEPAAGIRSSRVISLADDIARSMSAVSARVAAIPGRNVIGIELPNQKRETVYLRDLLSAAEYETTNIALSLALGKNIGGEPIIADLARMPHLLIAGTTGSGKSVAINTMILSLLYRLSPHECKMIMIDPKMLELSVYDGIPHLLTPVVTDAKKAVVALKWTVREMEDRYRRMSKLGVRNIAGYNDRIGRAKAKGEVLKRTVQTGFDANSGAPVYEEDDIPLTPMPLIVVVVDEMADLMLVAGKDIEGAVQRLAQMARAAGIHIIMATQRPSVDVITGTIKANFPTRISFQVTSKIDSRTILGEQGAEQLLGQGDMLYMEGGGRIRRVHGPFVSDTEVEDVVKYLKTQGTPEYLDAITEEPEELDPASLLDGEGADGEGSDDLYDKAVAIVARDRKASTSYIQRRLQIGYNRAARIVEKMEEEGVVSAPNHSGKREVLVGDHS
jgi:S-DNA-T family DNA segregation ATPase FtsK/SpoIIIE